MRFIQSLTPTAVSALAEAAVSFKRLKVSDPVRSARMVYCHFNE